MIATPREVLDFWYKDTDPKLWFAEDDAFDARIREKFEETWRAARDGGLEDWKAHVDGALAFVIVCDQFSRNMFRETAGAFSTDALARIAADRAIRHKFDLEVPASVRYFFYMPFMHSENLSDQERCVALFAERLGKDHPNYRYALKHRDIIARFGRFPARNKALGRATTPEEAAFLAKKQPS